MAEFDFDAARRWARFDRQKTLARRGDNVLSFVHANLIGGRDHLLDTCVYRLQGRSPQDCVLFLQGQKLGLVVLSANVGDYDILLQLIPSGRALFYRRK